MKILWKNTSIGRIYTILKSSVVLATILITRNRVHFTAKYSVQLNGKRYNVRISGIKII